MAPGQQSRASSRVGALGRGMPDLGGGGSGGARVLAVACLPWVGSAPPPQHPLPRPHGLVLPGRQPELLPASPQVGSFLVRSLPLLLRNLSREGASHGCKRFLAWLILPADDWRGSAPLSCRNPRCLAALLSLPPGLWRGSPACHRWWACRSWRGGPQEAGRALASSPGQEKCHARCSGR